MKEKKIIIFFISIMVVFTCIPVFIIPVSADATDIIFLWDTTETSPGSSASNQARLPLESTGTYNFNVSWGDGNYDIITVWNQANVTHTYASSGSKTITIKGTCYGFCFNNTGDRKKLREVNQWGNLRVGNTGSYFYGSMFIRIYATDTLDLTGTTTLAHMFDGAEYLNDASIGNWDTKNITNMKYLFHNAYRFNRDISNWDVGNVTDTSYMFASDTSSSVFNQNLGNWNVSKVTNMAGMFSRTAFNYDIGNWDVSNVTTMSSMFSFTSAFNKSIDNWDVSKVTDISYMFYGASAFSKDLNSWDVANVTTMWSTFRLAVKFNGNISNWDTGKVTNFDAMFQQAYLFNQNIGGWDTHSVTIMEETFDYANAFNQNLGGWNVKNVTTFQDMLYNVHLSTENYDATLVGWASQPVQNGKSISFGTSKYTASPGAGGIARAHLTSVHSWTITDGGSVPYNHPPVYGTPSPVNGSTEQNTSLIWSISISDQNGDTFNWTIECNNSQSGSGNDESNGTKSLSLSGLLTFHQYRIWVNTSDGVNEINAWFIFTTKSNTAPSQPSNPDPSNNTDYMDVYNIWLNCSVSDPDGDAMTVSFYWGNGTLIDTITGVVNNTVASLFLPDHWSRTILGYTNCTWVTHDTTHTWYAVANDTLDETQSPTWNFHTGKAWDLNSDRFMNSGDISILVSHYALRVIPPGASYWDIDENSYTNAGDVSSLVSHYGQIY